MNNTSFQERETPSFLTLKRCNLQKLARILRQIKNCMGQQNCSVCCSLKRTSTSCCQQVAWVAVELHQLTGVQPPWVSHVQQGTVNWLQMNTTGHQTLTEQPLSHRYQFKYRMETIYSSSNQDYDPHKQWANTAHQAE